MFLRQTRHSRRGIVQSYTKQDTSRHCSSFFWKSPAGQGPGNIPPSRLQSRRYEITTLSPFQSETGEKMEDRAMHGRRCSWHEKVVGHRLSMGRQAKRGNYSFRRREKRIHRVARDSFCVCLFDVSRTCWPVGSAPDLVLLHKSSPRSPCIISGRVASSAALAPIIGCVRQDLWWPLSLLGDGLSDPQLPIDQPSHCHRELRIEGPRQKLYHEWSDRFGEEPSRGPRVSRGNVIYRSSARMHATLGLCSSLSTMAWMRITIKCDEQRHPV